MRMMSYLPRFSISSCDLGAIVFCCGQWLCQTAYFSVLWWWQLVIDGTKPDFVKSDTWFLKRSRHWRAFPAFIGLDRFWWNIQRKWIRCEENSVYPLIEALSIQWDQSHDTCCLLYSVTWCVLFSTICQTVTFKNMAIIKDWHWRLPPNTCIIIRTN